MTSLEEVLSQGPPWYGIRVAEGTWRYVSGLSGGDHRMALKLTHQWRDAVVEVETEVGDLFDPRHEDWSALQQVLFQSFGSADLTADAFPLRFDIGRKEALINIDGVSVPFVVIGWDAASSAWGRAGDRTVRIHARRYPIDVIDLVSVDPTTDYDIHDHYR